MDFDDTQNDCRTGPQWPRHDTQLNPAVRPTHRAGGFLGARSSNCRSWSADGPAFSSKCSSTRGRTPRAPSPQPAWYAQLRSNAAALPPFIMRHAILMDPRMRPPMKHSTSSQRTGHLIILIWLSDVRLAVFVARRPPLGALLGAIWTARPQLGSIPWPQRSRSRAIIQVVFCYFLCRAGLPRRHGFALIR